MTENAEPTREIHVWHRDGRIVAWGHLADGAPDNLVAEPVAQPGQGVISAVVAEAALPRLHETHLVDVAAGNLRSRAGLD
ncbi:MAG: hypothetical protein ACR2N4_09130 [Jatrophihabitans sp.]